MIKVSIIIPTYNYANFILEAIDSIICQTYPQELIEIIVVDDGSTDNTMEVLQPLTDSKVLKYYYQTNKGKANATAFGINNSSGKYIFNLDADDYFFPNKISESVSVFEADNSIVHVASPAVCSDKNKWEGDIEKIPKQLLGRVLDGNEVLNFFYYNNILHGGGSTFAVRSSVIQKITIPDGVDMYIDEFLILAIFPKGKIYFNEKPLSVWRIHTSNYSGINSIFEKKILKGERLLKSSSFVLEYLFLHITDYSSLIKLYQLVHLNREMGFKQLVKKKTMIDILKYSYNVFVKLNIDFSTAKKHFVFNLLIPTPLHIALKKIINR